MENLNKKILKKKRNHLLPDFLLFNHCHPIAVLDVSTKRVENEIKQNQAGQSSAKHQHQQLAKRQMQIA